MFSLFAAATVSTLVFLSITGITLNRADFVRVLPDLNQKWMTAFEAEDWDALADLYFHDNEVEPATATGPGMPTFFGAEAVTSVFKGAHAAGVKRVELHTGYCRHLSYDHGIERGRYLFFTADEENNGASTLAVDEGHYQVWWQRTQKDAVTQPDWKLHADIFSSSIAGNQQGRPLDVPFEAMTEWTEAFMKCFGEHSYAQCKPLFYHDIRTFNLNNDEQYSSDDFHFFIDGVNTNVRGGDLFDRAYAADSLGVEKVSQNELQINYTSDEGNAVEMHVFIDFSTGTAWKLTLKQTESEGNKADL